MRQSQLALMKQATFAEIHRMRIEHFRGPAVRKKTYYKPDEREPRETREYKLRLHDPRDEDR